MPAHLFLATPAAILAALCSASKTSFAEVVMAKRRFRCAVGISVGRFDRLQSPRSQNGRAKSPSTAAICGLNLRGKEGRQTL